MGPRRRTATALVLVGLLAAVSACGRRGDPRPPAARLLAEPPPRISLVARAGDEIRIRFAEPATTWAWEALALHDWLCLPGEPDPEYGGTLSVAGGDWQHFPSPVTAALALRLRSVDGRRSSPWLRVPAAAATPGPPAVTAVTTPDGRVTLFPEPATVFVEQFVEPNGPRLLLGPVEGRWQAGPFPPERTVRWLVWSRHENSAGTALGAGPTELVVTFD